MGHKVELSAKQRDEIASALKRANSKEEYQRALCLWLRAEQDLSARQIARMLGMSFGGVRNIHSRYLKHGKSILTNIPLGGRLHVNLSLSGEKSFLAPFEKTAVETGILVVSEIHKAYEQYVGYKVPASTVYRLLGRHGWRKIAPRPSHPKADIEIQEAFKKTPRQSCVNSRHWTKNL